jgi:hypothetical protein
MRFVYISPSLQTRHMKGVVLFNKPQTDPRKCLSYSAMSLVLLVPLNNADSSSSYIRNIRRTSSTSETLRFGNGGAERVTA